MYFCLRSNFREKKRLRYTTSDFLKLILIFLPPYVRAAHTLERMNEQVYVLKLTDGQVDMIKEFMTSKGWAQELEPYSRYRAMEEVANEYGDRGAVFSGSDSPLGNKFPLRLSSNACRSLTYYSSCLRPSSKDNLENQLVIRHVLTPSPLLPPLSSHPRSPLFHNLLGN